MISVTEHARQELKSILSANVDHPQACLRLTAGEQGQLGLGIDIEASGDWVAEHEGSKVLLVENGLAASLEGMTLDVEDTGEGSELVICESGRASN